VSVETLSQNRAIETSHEGFNLVMQPDEQNLETCPPVVLIERRATSFLMEPNATRDSLRTLSWSYRGGPSSEACDQLRGPAMGPPSMPLRPRAPRTTDGSRPGFTRIKEIDDILVGHAGMQAG